MSEASMWKEGMWLSIFADLGQVCGGRDVENSVSDKIGYYFKVTDS